MGVVLAGLVGFVLGALLPGPVYRLSVGMDEPARTTCDHCGQTLSRRFRCPQCTNRWGPPWWATAVVASASSAVFAWVVGADPVVPLLVALAVLGTGLGAIDLACHRLPAQVVNPAIVVAAVALLGLAALTGAWGAYGRALLGAAVMGLAFLVLFLVPGDNLGFGDVRLAVVLGLFLGFIGWPAVIWGILLPWLVNGPVVVVLLLAQRVGRRSRLPFGPAMLVGALLAVALPVAVPAILGF